MNNREFVLWLWGFLEICHAQPINRKMLFIIRNHLNLAKAVDGELGAFNQIISSHIAHALENEASQKDAQFFEFLKELVGNRLLELEKAA